MKKMVLGMVSTALAFGMLAACGNVNEPNDPALNDQVPTEDPYLEEGELDGNLGEEDINEGVDTQGFRGNRSGNLDPQNLDRGRMNNHYRN